MIGFLALHGAVLNVYVQHGAILIVLTLHGASFDVLTLKDIMLSFSSNQSEYNSVFCATIGKFWNYVLSYYTNLILLVLFVMYITVLILHQHTINYCSVCSTKGLHADN